MQHQGLNLNNQSRNKNKNNSKFPFRYLRLKKMFYKLHLFTKTEPYVRITVLGYMRVLVLARG